MKLNFNVSKKKTRKQALEEVAYMIDAYLIKNNITTTKFCTAQILPSRDITIQTTSIKKAKKLRKEDGQIKVLGNKAKLT